MVRLSLVNLYLHGFTDPHIYEYDTLTSQDRWNEYADVILANPPFMSPKGGIKPHNRFSVQSKRSEVLFVDYMAEHLTPSGRAGIIVPEGIIFQSQTAYKQLRKMLVEDYLVAVVSLPAGVFNPYSGVKTSILILDKSLARTRRHHRLLQGRERRLRPRRPAPRDRQERPAAGRRPRPPHGPSVIPAQAGIQRISSPAITPGLLVVEKTRIAANGDYNLSGERYRENGGTRSPRFPSSRLGRSASSNPRRRARRLVSQPTVNCIDIRASRTSLASSSDRQDRNCHGPSHLDRVYVERRCAVVHGRRNQQGSSLLERFDEPFPRLGFDLLRESA